MSNGTEAKIKEIFVNAVELQGKARDAFLEAVCVGQPQLRTRVEVLLAAAEEPDQFLRGAGVPAAALGHVEGVGASVGPYRLIEQLGEGGFGSVYLAEQVEPVRRQVALKVLKAGMDTKQVIARFEQERQALAVMDHPNIAKVFDGGATESGRPYFVMECVRGEPITTFCDAHELSIPARIDLFLQVCAAVQHAHSKGIIHRDIKPGNILVGMRDGKPLAQVIDFGIAKALDQAASAGAVVTEMRQLVGTPEYMSPEQAEGSRDIDVRSDVYALGVLLYELLSGSTPLEPRSLRELALAELQRMIRETEPVRPSTRIAGQSEASSLAAKHRSTQRERLHTMLRGELDWIVMRAIEKDRARRYDSPGSLAADLSRYRAGEAVEAAPPSAMYRMKKVVRRNRAAVVVAGVVGAALITTAAMAVWQARTQRRLAEAAVAARMDAVKHREDVEQIADFQASQLQDIDLEKMGLRLRADILAKARDGMVKSKRSEEEIAARQAELRGLLADANFTDVAVDALDSTIFDRALQAVHEKFAEKPRIKAGLLLTIAASLSEIAMYEKAMAPQMEGLALQRQHSGDDAIETLNALGGAAALQKHLGKFDDAEASYRELVERCRRAHPNEPITSTALNNLAVLLQGRSKLDEAEPLYREVLQRHEREGGPDSRGAIAANANLGFLYYAQGKLDLAETQFQRALERQRRLPGAREDDTLTYMGNLAAIYHTEGKLAETETLLREVVAARVRLNGERHDETLRAKVNLSVLMESKGDMAEAERLDREVLEGFKLVYKPGHPRVLGAMSGLGIICRAQGKLEEAEELLRESLQGRIVAFGPAHTESLQSMHELGELRLLQNRPADAEKLFRDAATGFEAKLGAGHWSTAAARARLGEAILQQHRHAEAEENLLKGEPVLAVAKGSRMAQHRRCVDSLARLYREWNAAEPSAARAAQAARWEALLETLRKPRTSPDQK